ncbi:MAG: hypothetical protein GVY11_05000 [Gammaproteobacteria bacterium]|jgi:hypothetical protein|nr:hypothetical protein [Gammaproteobacteria bacterium]
MRNSAQKEPREGERFSILTVGAAVRILFGGAVFAVSLWFIAAPDSSVEWRYVAFFLVAGFLGDALLRFLNQRRKATRRSGSLADQAEVPDSFQDSGSADPRKNIPNALRGLHPPTDAKIVVGHSRRSSWILLFVLLAIGSGLLFLGWSRESLFPQWHVSASYLFNGFGGLLVLIALWPGNWRKHFIGLFAARNGIYAHGQGKDPDGHEWATPETRWLFVPWANVVDVRVGRVLKLVGGAPGGTWWPSTRLSLSVTPREAHEWFPHAEREPIDDGRRQVVSLDYSDCDASPEKTVPKLKRLRMSSSA